MDNHFESILQDASPEVAALAHQARGLIHEIMPDVVEVAWPRQRIAGFGVGPRKMSEQFAYIAVLKNRINLGFYYGADLEDPEGLLEGTGQLLRHVKIADAERLHSPALRRLLVQASDYLPRLKK